MSAIQLTVCDRQVFSTDVTLQDIYTLYQQFIDTYGYFPRSTELDSKHNMPQMRIVQRVLEDAGIPYADLCLKFGKKQRVRSSIADYDLWVSRIKQWSLDHGNVPVASELTSFGFPSPKWLVKYCPDESVTTYTEFLEYIGLESRRPYTKEEVSKLLIELEKKLGRAITRNDLCGDGMVSQIVITRLFGSLSKAKEELGLMKTPHTQPRPFEYYKGQLEATVLNFIRKTGRDVITWRDIESTEYCDNPCEHKTYMKSFKANGVDIRAYLLSLGVTMSPTDYANCYTFEDGERTVSSMERDFSSWLRENGFRYNVDYYRDYKYSNFTNATGRINCDYFFPYINGGCCIEIAGIITNLLNDDWRTHEYASEFENKYRDKMVDKESHLKSSCVPFLFLFSNEMKDELYKQYASEFLNIKKCV